METTPHVLGSDGVPQALCPSSKCSPGAILLGVVQADGTVAFLEQRRMVDEHFVALAREGRTPEKRFRFSDSCVKSGCQQWGNGRCGVIDRMLEANPEFAASEVLPACSIRSDCRWHLQWGARACAICPLIITDLRQETQTAGPPTEATGISPLSQAA